MAQIEQIECGSPPRQTQLLRMVKFGSGHESQLLEIWQGREFATFAAAIKIWHARAQLIERSFRSCSCHAAANAAGIPSKIWECGPLTHAREMAPVDHNRYYVNLKVEKKYLTLQVKCDII